MNQERYQKLIKKYEPKENKGKNIFLSFIVGGCLGFTSEIVASIFQNVGKMNMEDACALICVLLIFLASLFTALGFFDNLVSKYRAGLILPTTGFAHSITSSALDYRQDGMITGLGANTFKLAGSVILYGILSSFFFGVLGVMIYG